MPSLRFSQVSALIEPCRQGQFRPVRWAPRGLFGQWLCLTRGALSAGPARKGKVGRPRSGGGSACAIIGCRRPSRSKGYCAAHYQKQRMLTKTHRLPADWVDGAAPQSVKDIVLPRGRAGARALADARKK